MRIIKKIFKILAIALLILIVASITFVYITSPPLPDGANDAITRVLNKPLPQLIHGETGYANSDGTRIWYESISPDDSIKGTILLIMGISSDAIAWPQKFLDGILGAGYRIIRFDNRDTGLSDWSKSDYSISDMAYDGIAILDTLGIEKAHIFGVSMGGMIAQQIAIDYPERVQSLTSAMSSAYIMDPNLPGMSRDMIFNFVKLSAKYGILGGERNMAKLQIIGREMLKGDQNYTLDYEEIATQVIYNIRKRNGFNANATRRQQAAIISGGSRYAQLSKISAPTLVFHGKSDPIMPFEHGLKTAEVISHADTLWIKGMGHDIPNQFLKQIEEEIITHFASN